MAASAETSGAWGAHTDRSERCAGPYHHDHHLWHRHAHPQGRIPGDLFAHQRDGVLKIAVTP